MTSRRSSPARAAPYFLRERLASVATPSAAFDEARRPTDDLLGVAVRTRAEQPASPRVASAWRCFSDACRSVWFGVGIRRVDLRRVHERVVCESERHTLASDNNIMRNATRVFHLQTRSASFTARPRSPLAIKSSSKFFLSKLRGRRADDGRRRRRGARSEAEFLRLTLSRFFSRSNHDTLFPAPPPPESGASRASLAGDVKVLRRDRDRRRERILLRRARVARAFASRPRSVARGGERVFLRTLEPLD